MFRLATLFKSKPKEETTEIRVVEEVKEVNNVQTVEELFEMCLEHEFLTTSPIDGTHIAAIRSEDVMQTLCAYFNVNGEETEYSEYAK